ncbi:hypothetical protein BDN72DRAFT_838158 [Pluteus cervinus]|uniref:Uncharacterized protein n=1 Tax=Pluteus cervinus TaxID=181527 RepID=A0ACD3AZU8_9AGAR|nr:hypothetical protein BDN72DRAFT_838158 [Pluteus cervinus]
MYITSTVGLASAQGVDFNQGSIELDRPKKVVKDIPVIIVSYEGRKVFLRKERKFWDMLDLIVSKFDITSQHAGPSGADGQAITDLVLKTFSLDVCQGQEVEIDESAYDALCEVLDEIHLEVKTTQRLSTSTPAAEELDIAEGDTEPEVLVGLITPSPSIPRSCATTPHLPAERRSRQKKDVRSILALLNQDDTPGPSRSRRPGAADDDDEEENGYIIPRTPARTRGGNSSTVRNRTLPESSNSPRISRPAQSNMQHNDLSLDISLVAEPPTCADILTPEMTPIRTRPVPPRVRGPQVNEGEPFHVLIVGGQNQQREFEVKPYLTIRKVLGKACKVFGLDATRARLCFIVEDEDGVAEHVEDFEYDRNTTLTQAGIGENTSLFIRLVDEEDEE